MAISVSLSTRVSPELRQRLVAEARERKVALSTHVRELLAAGPGTAAGRRGDDGPVAREVECFFAGFGLNPRVGVYEQVALELARTVEAGGQAAIAAGRELLTVIDHALIRFPLDDEDEDDS